jgi:hypothetical protein
MKGSQTQKQTKNNAGKLLSGKHLAYKAIFLADGVVFLFEEVKLRFLLSNETMRQLYQ